MTIGKRKRKHSEVALAATVGLLFFGAAAAASADAGAAAAAFDRAGNGGRYDVFHVFDGTRATGGDRPYGALADPGDGNLYGVTTSVDRPGEHFEHGGLYRLRPSGRVEVVTLLGPRPAAVIAPRAGGSLVYTLIRQPYTSDRYGCGEIRRMDADGTVTELLSLGPRDQASIGCDLIPHLVEDADGRLYGATRYGSDNEAGSVFRLDPDGKATKIYAFAPYDEPDDRPNPDLAIAIARDGNLYMVGESGIFRITPEGAEEMVLRFDPAIVGYYPSAGLVAEPDGALYGTTSSGGAHSAGTAFRFDPHSGSSTVLHAFGAEPADGRYPNNELMEATDGFLYGTTSGGGHRVGRTRPGTIWRVRPDGTGYETLKSFDLYSSSDNRGPLAQAGPNRLVGQVVTGPPAPGGTGNGFLFRLKPGPARTSDAAEPFEAR